MHGGCEGKYKFTMKSAPSGTCLYSVDRPGYGESDDAGPHHELDACAGDMWEFVDNCIYAEGRHSGKPKCVLMGHSVGIALILDV